MNNWIRRTEAIANIAIIVVAIVIVGALGKLSASGESEVLSAVAKPGGPSHG